MTYKILSNVKNNGKTYIAGEVIELDESIADALVEDGVLEKISKSEGKVDPESETKLNADVDTEPDTEKEYSEMVVGELKTFAKAREIDVRGMKREDLIEALEESDKDEVDVDTETEAEEAIE